MEEMIRILREDCDSAYDHISNYYNDFSKEELANIAKELLYSIHTNAMSIEDDILNDVADELTDRYDYLFDDDEQDRGR